MATSRLKQPSQTTGYDCEFMKKPSEAVQSECPVCLQILRQPYQVSCCGYSFCQVCIERIKTDKQACPTCNKRDFYTFPNKGLQRSLYLLEVYCSHKQEGCEWKGKLGQLDNHLNLSPQPDKQLEGCGYSEFECIYCSELIKRCNIKVHQDDLCPKHPFSCEYCQNYESHYEDVLINHWPVCGYHPIQCPNDCGRSTQRRAIENHVTRDCPKTIIDCDFHHVGCDVRLPRKDMPAHLKADLITHTSLQVTSYKQFQEKVNKLERGKETLAQELATMQQDNEQVTTQGQELHQQIAMLQASTKTLSSVMLPIAKHLRIRPKNSVELTMQNYELRNRNGNTWFSQALYSHPGGYKFCLSVDANGYGDAEGTHISVYIRLMRGEFDDHLNWPLQGEFAIQILNKSNRGHVKRIRYNSSHLRCATRVLHREISEYGGGCRKFISQHKVERNYLRNDCLYFRITCKNTY